MTLGRLRDPGPSGGFHIPRAKEPQRLPEILSRAEVAALIAATASRRDRALLATTYGAGLRVSEAVHLKVGETVLHFTPSVIVLRGHAKL